MAYLEVLIKMLKLRNYNFKLKDSQHGFSLIEVFVAIAVIGILIGIVFGQISNFRNMQILKTETESVVSVINQARSMTLSSEDSSQYGIHFESSRIVLFKGTGFFEPSLTNQEINLNSSIILSSINFTGGGDDIIFERLTGDTNQDGSFIISLVSDPLKQKTISITKIGIISSN